MQRVITKQTLINSSWEDITASLVPILQNMKTRHGGMECLEKAHTVFRPSHTPCWFTSTLPIRESNGSNGRQPTSSDFTCWIRADNVCTVPKASNAAEHSKHICSRPRPSLPKHFRLPTVGPVCSCLESDVAVTALPVGIDRRSSLAFKDAGSIKTVYVTLNMARVPHSNQGCSLYRFLKPTEEMWLWAI